MAAQQPNMEALQKVARRRRGTGGNQDMIRKINDLHKKWQKLWLGATDRHRVLTDARMRLKDVSSNVICLLCTLLLLLLSALTEYYQLLSALTEYYQLKPPL